MNTNDVPDCDMCTVSESDGDTVHNVCEDCSAYQRMCKGMWTSSDSCPMLDPDPETVRLLTDCLRNNAED